jgi:polyisoprenyl-phosphate glycosyltransferase
MKKIKILIPIYNDWKSVFKLIENIDLQITDWSAEVSAIIVNDASNDQKPSFNSILKNLKSVQIINMKHNKGHARCNAVGLKYIMEKEDFDYVIPMDGDGEDRPEELNLIFNRSKEKPDSVITANRIKRSEGIFFSFSYLIHKLLTFIFTGHSIKFGNYVCLPKLFVKYMVEEKATWSSFSGSLTKLVKHKESIPSIRGNRYFGPSKMSFLNLIKHSLSIIAVFKKTVIFRSVIFLLAYFFFIYKFLSIITLIPIFFVFILIYSVISLSRRESIEELDNSLSNIDNIENLN